MTLPTAALDDNDLETLLETAFYLLERANRERPKNEQDDEEPYGNIFKRLSYMGQRGEALALLVKAGMSETEGTKVYEHFVGHDLHFEEISRADLERWVLDELAKDPEVKHASSLGIYVVCRVGPHVHNGFVYDQRSSRDERRLVIQTTGERFPFEEVAQFWRMVPKNVMPA